MAPVSVELDPNASVKHVCYHRALNQLEQQLGGDKGMEGLAAIARELDVLEGIQGELIALSTRSDANRRFDLVKLRRRLSSQIGEVGSVTEAVLSAIADADTLQMYREKFSRVRSATAIHQASWPAVTLDERKDEYLESAMGVNACHREFIMWTRQKLTSLKSLDRERK